jgi:hypothetical protein
MPQLHTVALHCILLMALMTTACDSRKAAPSSEPSAAPAVPAPALPTQSVRPEKGSSQSGQSLALAVRCSGLASAFEGDSEVPMPQQQIAKIRNHAKLYALQQADAKGLTSANIELQISNARPDTKYFFPYDTSEAAQSVARENKKSAFAEFEALCKASFGT